MESKKTEQEIAKEVAKETYVPLKLTICYDMRDYSQEECFVRQTAEAKADIEKWGLPKDIHLLL